MRWTYSNIAMIVKDFNVKIAVKKITVKDAVVYFVLELVGRSRIAQVARAKYAVGVPSNLRVYDAIQYIVENVVMLVSVTYVYVIGVVTVYLQLSAITSAVLIYATNAFQNGNATNVTPRFVATVGRFQNAKCASKGVAATVIHQGLGVEMKGMDTVLNVLLSRLTLEWKVL